MDRPTHKDTAAAPRYGDIVSGQHTIEEVLAELAVVAEEVIAEAEVAEARMDEMSDAREAMLEQRIADGRSRCLPDPRYALAGLRDTLAVDVAQAHRTAAREFAAWWADVATLAVVAALNGGQVHPARLAAADPTVWFDDGDLQHLPDIPEAERALTRLAANMAATSVSRFSDRDMATLAAEHAARFGLQVGYGDNGQAVVKQDGTPEGRRRRLWGGAWIEDGVPGLPTSEELASLLSSRGVPASTVDAVTEATRAVERAVSALHQANELEDNDSDDEETIDALMNQALQLTSILRHYARNLTNALPTLKTAVQSCG